MDPGLVARSTAELAAITPAQEAAEIRAALGAVLDAWAMWRADAAYPRRRPYRETPAGHKLAADRDGLIAGVRDAVDKLPADAPPPALVDVAGPVLNAWWPDSPAPAAAVAQAVERLRFLATHRRGWIEIAKREKT